MVVFLAFHPTASSGNPGTDVVNATANDFYDVALGMVEANPTDLNDVPILSNSISINVDGNKDRIVIMVQTNRTFKKDFYFEDGINGGK